ncbi:hypothetical protein DB31_2224 [Hyalangium minutum]|uniref:Uncharacterized protein n=1 Tax=Hyalangium minutum TaxID=394096 RepID=A0A085W9R7_9BACT|nr:hypothetical protein DB31_2224 [Hyalangium minutum]
MAAVLLLKVLRREQHPFVPLHRSGKIVSVSHEFCPRAGEENRPQKSQRPLESVVTPLTRRRVPR